MLLPAFRGIAGGITEPTDLRSLPTVAVEHCREVDDIEFVSMLLSHEQVRGPWQYLLDVIEAHKRNRSR